MKTTKVIRAIFTVSFFSIFFIACETDSLNEEVGIDEIDEIEKSFEDAEEEVKPG
ncbi:hypothetical protein [Aquimarina sp. 2304DJ70-9]|uniref:hypothetical protein n=1 Tax=Aquimarina penaris TaxID=3231044 RepID=UPI00346343FE